VPFGLRKDAKIALLAEVPLFAGLSKADLRLVASLADEVDLDEGAVLTREGDRGREFFVLLDGEVDVRRQGRKLATRGSGDFIGEIALISNIPRTATVTAVTPLRALVISEVAFRSLLEQEPPIALKVLDAVAHRLPPEPA
jgi:CRP/FNR family transcriptional regulator, cyclic AMP receptor protein